MKYLFSKTLAACALSVFVAGCSARNDAPRENTRASAAAIEYADDEIFDGIFFGKGPVAALLPEMWGGEPVAGGDMPIDREQAVNGLMELQRMLCATPSGCSPDTNAAIDESIGSIN